jgi:hypothetical protein
MSILNLTRICKSAFAAVIIVAGFAVGARSQSTFFYNPSTDILPEGQIGIRFGAKYKVGDQDARKKFSGFTPRVIYGLRKNVEVGVNLFGNIQPGADATTIVPTAKWRFYMNEKHEVSVVMGDSVYVPVRKNKKYNLGNYFYVIGSKGFSKTGTKVTAGAYYFTQNVVAKNAARVGGQFALEQKITPKFGFLAEWMTGRHSSGNMTAGFRYKINKRVGSIIGYTVSNDRALQGNHYFYSAIGINLF